MHVYSKELNSKSSDALDLQELYHKHDDSTANGLYAEYESQYPEKVENVKKNKQKLNQTP